MLLPPPQSSILNQILLPVQGGSIDGTSEIGVKPSFFTTKRFNNEGAQRKGRHAEFIIPTPKCKCSSLSPKQQDISPPKLSTAVINELSPSLPIRNDGGALHCSFRSPSSFFSTKCIVCKCTNGTGTLHFRRILDLHKNDTKSKPTTQRTLKHQH